MATVAEVLQISGEELGCVAKGDTLSSDDNAILTATYNQVYAAAKKDGMATWAIDGTVPDEVVPFLANIISNRLINKYRPPSEVYNMIVSSYKASVRDFKKYTSPSYVSLEEVEDF